MEITPEQAQTASLLTKVEAYRQSHAYLSSMHLKALSEIVALKEKRDALESDVSNMSVELIDLYKSYNIVFQALQIEKTNNDNWVSSNESLLVENEMLKSKNQKMIKLLEFINDHDGVGRIVKVDIANLLDEIAK